MLIDNRYKRLTNLAFPEEPSEGQVGLVSL